MDLVDEMRLFNTNVYVRVVFRKLGGNVKWGWNVASVWPEYTIVGGIGSQIHQASTLGWLFIPEQLSYLTNF